MATTTGTRGLAVARRGRETETARATLAVVGLGYVGLPLAILAATKGYRVRGYDIDAKKVKKLAEREAPFLSKEEAATFARLPEFEATADESILRHADIYVICVPTPVREDHEPDLAPLEGACGAVGRHLSKGALVIVESTVSPGVCETSALPLLEEASGLIAGRDFFFAHCPERVNPGDPHWSVRNIPRVLGASDPQSFLRAYAFYSSLIESDIHPLRSIKEAEAAKMVENAFRDINIAFVNELAMSFAKAGIDIKNVLEGASTKPFGFMPHAPGCGVGGHCIPVDPYYLIRYGRDNGFEHDFLVTARRINNGMPRYVVNQLMDALTERGQSLEGADVALLGLSYKKDVPDLRESPALLIRDLLEQEGAHVTAYDPYLPQESNAGTLEEALDGKAAVLIATNHSAFSRLTPQDFEKAGVPLVIDGRNCLYKEAFEESGITYRGIGR